MNSTSNKCLHGMYDMKFCAICKEWPSLEKMRQRFPHLSNELFLIMRPDQRIAAMKTDRITNDDSR